MAQGDVIAFDDWIRAVMEKQHDHENDAFLLALHTGTSPPTVTTAIPHWGGTGTTDLSANEAPAGGNYSAGGASCANPTVSINAGVVEIDCDDPATWAVNASNPTDVEFGVLYNNTLAAKLCVLYVDLGGTFDMTTGDLSVSWGAPMMTANQA